MEDQNSIHINSQVDLSKWLQLISDSPYATPFHTPQFYHFCNSTSGHLGLVVGIIGNNNNYDAICVVDIIIDKRINFFFTRRAIIYGSPILSSEKKGDALVLLLKNLHNELKSKVIYIEIRNNVDFSEFSKVFSENSWKYIPWLNIRKDLEFNNLDELLSSFKYNLRRQIRLSIKEGLTYQEAKNENELKDVYMILKYLYKYRVGLPLPKFQYFKDFFNNGSLKVFTVNDNEVIVGGSLCLVLNNKSIYTFYYCGLHDYKKNSFPSHLAILAAMEYGIKNELKYIDFMGAGNPAIEYGVRNYKMKFGGKLIEAGRYLKIENRFLYYLGTKAITFMKRKK